MTTTIAFNSFGEDFVLEPKFDRYTNGRLAISFWFLDQEMDMMAPFSKLTVNLPEEHLNEGEFFVKDWSENEPLVAHLEEAGWLIRTGREVSSGFIFPAVMRASGPLLDMVAQA